MEFASEMVIKAVTLGFKVAEVPTTLRPDGRDRPPHLRPWRDGWRHLRFLLLHSPRFLFIYPGVALIMLGLLGSALLARGAVRVSPRLELDIHSLVVACFAVLIGGFRFRSHPVQWRDACAGHVADGGRRGDSAGGGGLSGVGIRATALRWKRH